jgi:hypothetical protein
MEQKRKSTARVGDIITMPELIGLMFQSSIETHLAHLLQKDKTLARHEAFADYYTAIDGQIDTLCETYMGRNTVTSLLVPECKPVKEPIVYFNKLYDIVTKVRDKQTDGYILNQMDELQQTIAHALYKFKNITT